MNVDVNGITLYYEKAGSGKPLIMLHGNGESCRIFDKAVSVLKSHFTVYTLDSRGHGNSAKASEYHYCDMAKDVFAFITKLGIEKPIIYGFSDGGIIALLTVIKHPTVASALIISGANTCPSGLKPIPRFFMGISYIFNRSLLTRMMLTEPHITNEQLNSIDIPTAITAADKDIIKLTDTEYLHKSIKNSSLKIFVNETHGSYIVNSEKIAYYIIL